MTIRAGGSYPVCCVVSIGTPLLRPSSLPGQLSLLPAALPRLGVIVQPCGLHEQRRPPVRLLTEPDAAERLGVHQRVVQAAARPTLGERPRPCAEERRTVV